MYYKTINFYAVIRGNGLAWLYFGYFDLFQRFIASKVSHFREASDTQPGWFIKQ
jgi:hypothetical protein